MDLGEAWQGCHFLVDPGIVLHSAGAQGVEAAVHTVDPLAKLVAVCDVIKERADILAEKLKVRAYYSLKDMLKNEDLDIVDVCTGGPENGGWHFEPTMEAMAAAVSRVA